MKLDPNWLLILRSAYSSWAIIASGFAAITAAVQTENNYAIAGAVLSFLALLGRVVVQPVLREQMKRADTCVDALKQ
jgi:hypothetical protein